MNLILSRKGFDSGTGGCPSPILPDGRLYSFPIPEANPNKHKFCYRDLQGDVPIAKLLQDLTQAKAIAPTLNSPVHLDPDLDPVSLNRLPGWRPSFGQASAAERHLRNQGVGPGDLFLFFGWFRQVEQVGGSYRYVKTAPDIHVIFGWLQIGDRLNSHQPSSFPKWLHQHPHAQQPPHAKIDAIYTATKSLSIPVLNIPKLSNKAVSGGGLFKQFQPQLQLTAPGQQRSQWQLPSWFLPNGQEPQLTYHRNPERWQRSGEHVLLKTVGRGQEFVQPVDSPQQLAAWLTTLFAAR